MTMLSSLRWQRTKSPVVLDWPLVALVAALLTVGLVMMGSASVEYAAGNYKSPFYFTTRQLIFTVLALISGYIAFQVPMSFWQRHDGKSDELRERPACLIHIHPLSVSHCRL